MNKYSTSLSSLTGGRGVFNMKFAAYEKVPQEVQDELLAAYAQPKKKKNSETNSILSNIDTKTRKPGNATRVFLFLRGILCFPKTHSELNYFDKLSG